MPDALRINGKDHPFQAPASLVVCLELHDYMALRSQDANGGSTRAFAAGLCLCFPSLRPKPQHLPAWTGENQAEVGGACLQHLLTEHKMPPAAIGRAVIGFDLLGHLRAVIPQEAEVVEAVGNS